MDLPLDVVIFETYAMRARSRFRFSWGLRRSRRVAAEPTQNLRQILAAVLQHMVDGSAAFVVPGAGVGAMLHKKRDDLLAVLRVLVRGV